MSPTSPWVNVPAWVLDKARSAAGGGLIEETVPEIAKSGVEATPLSRTYQVPPEEVPP